jgi:G3E family GTPase
MKSSVSLKSLSKQPTVPSPAVTAGLRFCLLGGFLGAGKTSFLRAYADWLGKRGLKVGLVANDQAGGLVDGQRFQTSASAAVAEVTVGCFCCKADALVNTLKTMASAERPDVILAEPVGSCADLVATVVRPLQRVYGLGFSMPPYVALVDGRRLCGAKITTAGVVFHADVDYIFWKQLEEADVIVVNKVDLLTKAEREKSLELLRERLPGKALMAVSVMTGEGLEPVFTLMQRAERTDGLTVEMEKVLRPAAARLTVFAA